MVLADVCITCTKVGWCRQQSHNQSCGTHVSHLAGYYNHSTGNLRMCQALEQAQLSRPAIGDVSTTGKLV